MPAPTFRYHAFISHEPPGSGAEGRRWGEWLRHSLETFEVPPEVAGRRTPAGSVPSRLYPVFVSDGDELTPAIREAIEQSRVMIVVCSPAAARSPRVTAEIGYFKKLGRDRVLALIVAGEPNARREEDECFPETLKYEVREDGEVDREWRLHPLAADVRDDGRGEGYTTPAALGVEMERNGGIPMEEIRARMDGYAEKLEMARLKLIAGVLAVPPTELAKRDSAAQLATVRRGRRRAMFVAFAAVLAAGAGGFFAWREYAKVQEEAEARSRSNQLIGSLHHELREKMEPAGQLPLLAEVNDRVVSQLTLATRDDNDPKLLSALETSLADAVAIHMARADFTSALAAAQSSLQVHERMSKASSAPPDLTLRRITTLRRIAAILVRMNQQLSALAQAEAARKLGTDLLRDDPGDLRVAIETAWADYDAGDILAAVGKHGEARTAFTAGREIAARIASKEPEQIEFQRALAEGHARLGEISQLNAEFPEAMAQYYEAEKIMAALATTHTENIKVQGSLVFVRKRMGLTLALQREFPAAIAQQRQVVELTARLAKNEPSNANWQYEHAEALRRLAETLPQSAAANRTEALTLFQQALDHLELHFKGETDPRASRLRAEIEGLKKAALR